MSTQKKRDVAKEFVDFLLSESKNEAPAPTQNLKTEDQKTAVLPHDTPADAKEEHSEITQVTKLKVVEDKIPNYKPSFSSERGRAIYGDVAQLVGGAEAIRVAQARIMELEKERDNLRDEIEKLLVTCEALQRSNSESKGQIEKLERKQKEKLEILEEEKIVIHHRLQAREKELHEIRKINEEMDLRFQNDLKKVRVREREYENKNIILKAENIAVARSKDEMILDLKRKLDQMQFEIENYRGKFSDTELKMSEFHDRQARTVKALRLALNILEGSDNEEKPKKASGND